MLPVAIVLNWIYEEKALSKCAYSWLLVVLFDHVSRFLLLSSVFTFKPAKSESGMSSHSVLILSSRTTSPRPDPFTHRKRNTNGTDIPRSDFHLVFVAFVCSGLRV